MTHSRFDVSLWLLGCFAAMSFVATPGCHRDAGLAPGLKASQNAPGSGAWEKTVMNNYATDEVTLPFTASAAISPAIPPFIDRAINKSYYDAPFIPVTISDEYWIIQTECNVAPNYTPDTHVFYRWKGTNVDDCKQQPSGRMDSSFPRPGGQRHWIMGLWYDAPSKILYACMHTEFNYTGTDCINGFNWCPRTIRLASSTDKGLTWHYQGEIITSEYPTGLLDFYAMSGSYKSNGCGDFDFYIDQTSGYAYIYFWSSWSAKNDFKNKPFPFSRYVARCALSDKLAPGKWQKFYNGQWSQPGLGGKASAVLPNGSISDISYNTYLKKYIAIVPAGNGLEKASLFYQHYIAICSDLGKQDWTPCGYLPCLDGKPLFSQIISADGTDQYTSGQNFRVYRFYGNEKSLRLDVTLGSGQTVTPTMTQDYNYEPMPESSNPLESRQTKIVSCASPEMKYTGTGWAQADKPLYYEGKSKASALANDDVEFSFKGDAVYWRAVKSPKGGKAQVYIDNVLQREVDLYRPFDMPYQFTFIKTGLDPKVSHNIKVVVTGLKNPKSGGTLVGHMAFEYAAQSYKASAGFSNLAGKNNWFYQQYDGSTYSDLHFFAPDEKQFYNYWGGQGNTKVSNDGQTPDATEAVRKWVAPHDGKIRIQGAPALEKDSPDGVSVRIMINALQALPGQSLRGTKPAPHDFTITVKKSDAVCFIAKRNGTNPGVKVLWDPIITFVD